jgi:hypothetical protein
MWAHTHTHTPPPPLLPPPPLQHATVRGLWDDPSDPVMRQVERDRVWVESALEEGMFAGGVKITAPLPKDQTPLQRMTGPLRENSKNPRARRYCCERKCLHQTHVTNELVPAGPDGQTGQQYLADLFHRFSTLRDVADLTAEREAGPVHPSAAVKATVPSAKAKRSRADAPLREVEGVENRRTQLQATFRREVAQAYSDPRLEKICVDGKARVLCCSVTMLYYQPVLKYLDADTKKVPVLGPSIIELADDRKRQSSSKYKDNLDDDLVVARFQTECGFWSSRSADDARAELKRRRTAFYLPPERELALGVTHARAKVLLSDIVDAATGEFTDLPVLYFQMLCAKHAR